jgi:putative membrane protein
MHYMFGGFGGIGMIIFWIALIAAVIFLIRAFTRSSDRRDSDVRTPIEILKQRYAAGEITHDEFERTKHDILRG